MPEPIEADREQHQNSYQHTLVSQVGSSARFPADIIEQVFRWQQVQKPDQPKKSPIGTHPFRANHVKRRSGEFPWGGGSVGNAFTRAMLHDGVRLFLFFNHLIYLLFVGIGVSRVNNRRLRWFSILLWFNLR